jgi:hypothetical protein
MTTDNFCFYLQNRLIQQVEQEVDSTMILPPLVFPGSGVVEALDDCRVSSVS